MTKTTYFEVSTGAIISEEEYFERYFANDTDVEVECICLECGKEIPVCGSCDCERD